jgi:hypothetical protein
MLVKTELVINITGNTLYLKYENLLLSRVNFAWNYTVNARIFTVGWVVCEKTTAGDIYGIPKVNDIIPIFKVIHPRQDSQLH